MDNVEFWMRVTALFHVRRLYSPSSIYTRSLLVGGLLYKVIFLTFLREWSFVKVSIDELNGVLLTGFDSIN